MDKIKLIFKNILIKIFTSKSVRKKILSFSFFVLIASSFWFLNQLNEDFKEDILLPIEYKNLPQDKIQTLQLPKSLKLTIQASGYQLTNHYLTAEKTKFVVDLKKVRLRTNDREHFYVLINDIIESNKNQYTEKMQVLSAKPDTVKFAFEQVISKKVPITPEVLFELAPNMTVKSISCNPSSITIKGPVSILSKIKDVKTGTLNLGKIQLSDKKNIALKEIDLVHFSKGRTNVSIEIEQLTENKLSVPIQHNLPLNYKLIPSSIKLSYKVGLSYFNRISEDDFKVEIDTSESENNIRKIKIVEKPEKAIDIEYTPHFVEIIEVKDD